MLHPSGEDYVEELVRQRDELLAALDQKFIHGSHVMRPRVNEWLKHVEKKFPEDYRRTRSYYFLKSENPPEGTNVDKDDFPESDSAKTFFAAIRWEFLRTKE